MRVVKRSRDKFVKPTTKKKKNYSNIKIRKLTNKTASVFSNDKKKGQAKKFVLNPDTRRLICVHGTRFKCLQRKYQYDEENNIFILPNEQPLFDREYWNMNETVFTDEAKRLIIKERNLYGEKKESKYLKMEFFNHITSLQNIHECLYSVYQNEDNSIKINISFGYVTIKEETISLIKPGRNYFFSETKVIKNNEDLKLLQNEITHDSIIVHLTNQFPDTQTQLLGIYSMAVKITRLDYLIGGKITLPKYIIDSRFINSLQEVNNNLCFWACIALAKGCRKDRYKTVANELFTEFYRNTNPYMPSMYAGFDYIRELDLYEHFSDFAINIVSFYDNGTISYIIKTLYPGRSPIYLNLYLNHFSYITNFEKLAKVYLCKRCDAKFRDNFNMQTHFDTCVLEQKDVFNMYPKLWEKSRNLIVELSDYYDVDIDFKYNYLITFDLESIIQKIINKEEEDKLTYVSKHIPVSVSTATNVPGYEKVKFILSENPKEITKLMFEYFDEITLKSKEMMIQKMKPLLDCLEGKHLEQVESYCSVIPIVGFNTSFYDINLIANEGFINEILT